MKGKIASAKPSLEEADRQAIGRVFETGMIAEGDEIARFEGALAHAVGTSSAVAVSSGFAALHLALTALNVQGGEVIIPCVSTCPSMRNAVWAAGGTPVYADINPDDFNLSVEAVSLRVSPRTKAIIAPHHTGIPSNIPVLNELGVPVIEDCAQAIGASWQGRPVGSLGAVAIFSFYATKIITTVDGGAVCSTTPEIVERVRELRYYRHCQDQRMRYNYKMQNLHAALGCAQLRRLPDLLERRRLIASHLLDAFGSAGGESRWAIRRSPGAVYFKLAFCLPPSDRRRFLDRAQKEGVPASEEFSWITEEHKRFPHARFLMERIVTLPVYPALTDDEVTQMERLLRDGLASMGDNVTES